MGLDPITQIVGNSLPLTLLHVGPRRVFPLVVRPETVGIDEFQGRLE